MSNLRQLIIVENHRPCYRTQTWVRKYCFNVPRNHLTESVCIFNAEMVLPSRSLPYDTLYIHTHQGHFFPPCILIKILSEPCETRAQGVWRNEEEERDKDQGRVQRRRTAKPSRGWTETLNKPWKASWKWNNSLNTGHCPLWNALALEDNRKASETYCVGAVK